MPAFGPESNRHLNTLHPKLQWVLREAIKHADFAIVCGFRNQSDQDRAYAEGKSKLKWPHGEHNKQPSRAVDVAPYSGGIAWDDAEAFTLLAGIIKGLALGMGVKLTVGIDWDGDLIVKEHSFKDRPHLQLHESEI